MTEEDVVQDWWERLVPTQEPLPADLAFFSMDGHPWHVMLVAGVHPMRVIGACPIIGHVAERGFDEYLALGWTLKGYRRMPLPPPGGPAPILGQ